MPSLRQFCRPHKIWSKQLSKLQKNSAPLPASTLESGINVIIIIITKEYDYGGVMSEDCKDTLQTK